MIQRNSNFETTLSRSIFALIAGAGAGAIMTGFVLGVTALGALRGEGKFSGWDAFFVITPLAIALAFAGLVIGLVVVAAPIWWVFHRWGWRGWQHAAALGVVLTFPASLAIIISDKIADSGDTSSVATFVGNLTGREWQGILVAAGLMSIIGAVTGLTIWRCAYRPRSTI